MKFGPRSLLYYLTRDDSPVTASLLKQPWCPPRLCGQAPRCKNHCDKCASDPLCDRCPGLWRLKHHC